MKIEIDAESGCCNGVRRAIDRAEKHLQEKGSLLSLGAIVHNETELARLKEKGLRIIDYPQLETLHDSTVLFRAHGEPPSIYALAAKNNIKIIDCTCPVVLKLQQRIADTYRKMLKSGGQIVIFGKHGHAEVNGLIGQVEGNALVIENLDELHKAIADKKLDLTSPIAIFSQTTKDPEEYRKICTAFKELIISYSPCADNFTVFNTICRQVSSRHPHLIEFSKNHSIIIFVSGRESSNGKILYELCRSVNPRTHLIEHYSQIDRSWFRPDDTVGICGATSTPLWQLEEVARKI